MEVLSMKRVKKEAREAFDTFVTKVDTLPSAARETMSRSLLFHRNPNPTVQAYLDKLRNTLDRVYLTGLEKAKIEQITDLERSTSVPRERGEAKYESDKFDDLPALKQFMASDETEGRVYGFYGIKHAREVLESVKQHLPEGSLYEALGKGKTAYIAIEKPCWRQRRDWKRYGDDIKDLQKARSELATIQSDIRKSGFDCVRNSSKKQRTDKL